MWVVYLSQLLVAVMAALAALILGGPAEMQALVYGAAIGWTITLLTRRGTDRALSNAVHNTMHGVIAMYSGLVLRYAVAILGLLVGFRVMQLLAEPMLAGFILMVIVQALASLFLGARPDKREA